MTRIRLFLEDLMQQKLLVKKCRNLSLKKSNYINNNKTHNHNLTPTQVTCQLSLKLLNKKKNRKFNKKNHNCNSETKPYHTNIYQILYNNPTINNKNHTINKKTQNQAKSSSNQNKKTSSSPSRNHNLFKMITITITNWTHKISGNYFLMLILIGLISSRMPQKPKFYNSIKNSPAKLKSPEVKHVKIQPANLLHFRNLQIHSKNPSLNLSNTHQSSKSPK